MRFLIMSVLLMELLLSGVYSGDVLVEPRAKKLQCKSPKGKLGDASFYDCGQAVCKKSGKSADWNICPQNAKQTTVLEIQKTVKETEMKVKETEKTVNKIEKKFNETEIIVKETLRTVKKIEITVKETENTVRETENTVNEIEKKVKETENTVNEIEKKVKETENTVNEIENKVKETENTVNEIENKVKETEITVKETQRTVKETEKTVNEIEKKVNALLELAKPYGNLPVVAYIPHEFAIEKNKLVADLVVLGEIYIVSLDLLLTTTTGSIQSIIHLTLGGDSNVYGDRTPAVWLFNNGFYISSAINGNKNNDKIIYPPLQAEKWIHLEISQTLIANKHIFEVKVDDISYWVIENTAPAAFEKIKVFASDNFYTPAAGKIKNLKIQTKAE